VISGGAAGMINAIESSLPRSLAAAKRLIHRCRKVLVKVPAAAQEEIRGAYWAIFDTAALTEAGVKPGQWLVTAVQARIDCFAEKYAKLYPAAVRCLLSDCAGFHAWMTETKSPVVACAPSRSDGCSCRGHRQSVRKRCCSARAIRAPLRSARRAARVASARW
jgi:hypothetical protein